MDRSKGATREQWQHFSDVLSLTSALVPVVADVHARIAGSSKLRPEQLGKIPSRYNGNGLVAGFGKWTELSSSEDDVGAWSRHGGYSIGVQGRLDGLGAIDIDIADPDVVAGIVSYLEGYLLLPLPLRWRENSGKLLIPFHCASSFAKRVIKTASGAIEILGEGQHWVACGTHPSGVPYRWKMSTGVERLPERGDIPTLTLAELDTLIDDLARAFGISGVTQAKGASRAVVTAQIHVNDPIAKYLLENGWVTATRPDFGLDIRCPFGDGHTGGVSDGSSTTYFPAFTNGYAQGHFKCLHASCANRSDADFLEACGYLASGFEILAGDNATPEQVTALRDRTQDLQGLKLPRNRTGQIKASLTSLAAVMERPQIAGFDLRFDIFKQTGVMAWEGEGPRSLADADLVLICRRLEQAPYRFATIPSDLIRRAVTAHQHEHQYDSAHEWARALPRWDGIFRVERFAALYLKCDDTPYTRGVSRYLWTSKAGRRLTDQSGIKADMMVILVGGQGAGKSTAVRLMAADPTGTFCELDLGREEDARIRMIQGMTDVEVQEMVGFAKREQRDLKAWLSKTHDKWRQIYKEHPTVAARRCVFIGTTNEEEFLQDNTGERRYLPLRVGNRIDTEALERDRLQLWAEAIALYTVGGIDWADAERLARDVHGDHKVQDIWQPLVERWLLGQDGLEGEHRPVETTTLADVLIGAIGISQSNLSKRDEMRAAQILTALGWVKDKNAQIFKGARVRLWRKAA